MIGFSFKNSKVTQNSVRNGHSVPYGYFSKYGNNSAVYGIKCNSTNKQYIGSTKHIQRRLMKHFSELRLNRHRNKKLQSDYNKYGFNDFSIIIHKDKSKNLLYDEKVIQKSIGINDLYNEKISGFYITKEYRNQLANSSKSTHKTKEYRNKMSAIKTNKVAQYNLNEELIKVWDSAIQICEQCNYTRSVILSVCNGNKPRAYNYLWKYVDEHNNVVKDGYAKGRRKI